MKKSHIDVSVPICYWTCDKCMYSFAILNIAEHDDEYDNTIVKYSIWCNNEYPPYCPNCSNKLKGKTNE